MLRPRIFNLYTCARGQERHRPHHRSRPMQYVWSSLPPRRQLPAVVFLVFVLVLGGSIAPQGAGAQGFGVYEQGSCSMALGGAAVARPCDDASANFFNPAALLSTDGLTLSAGATGIFTAGEFTADYTGEQTELRSNPIAVPHLFGAYKLNPDLALGAAVYVPYGLETLWPREWDGAFEGYDNGLQTIYLQPTLSYQLTDRIRLGVAPILGIGRVTLKQRLDVSQQAVPSPDVPEGTTFGNLGIPFHTAFADAGLDAGGATAFGGQFGLQVKVTDRLDFGARYMLPMELEYEGDATFEQVSTGLTLPADNPFTPTGQPVSLDFVLEESFVEGPLVDQNVETSLTMPAQLVLGFAFQATDRLLVQADYQWTSWSDFDEIALDFERDALDSVRRENYNNTSAVRAGARYRLQEDLTLRAGYIFNQAAAPDRTVTPLLPEANRNHGTLGVGWWVTDAIEVNVAYQYLNQNDRRGRVRGERPGEENPTAEELNSGLYAFNGHLIGTTLTINL